MARARYDDHTVLPFTPEGRYGHLSACRVFTGWQVVKYLLIAAGLFGFLVWYPKAWFAVTCFAACGVYVLIIGYKLLIVTISVLFRAELLVTPEEIDALNDDELPAYTILVPMYKEPEVATKIVDSVRRLDYPQHKLDVKLLLEANDPETVAACRGANLPDCIEVVVVKHSEPKTKPKACNHGLEQARGKYLVIYDAEDQPDPDQLKKAVVAFRRIEAQEEKARERGRTPREVICLQGKLNYFNPRQNFMTKWFALEYTTWFDLFLPGLNKLGVPIPLGGTSNHFKTDVLKHLGGWDPFNVTEDCDLGMRIHGEGYATKILDSTTWEEANCQVGNWIRQRSRWVKGYIQTHLVHTRAWMGTSENGAVGSPGPAGRWRAFVAAFIVLLMGGALLLDAPNILRSMEEDRPFPLPNLQIGVFIVGGIVALMLLVSWWQGMRKLGILGYPSFLATVGGLSVTLLLNPIFWLIGLLYVSVWVWPGNPLSLAVNYVGQVFHEDFNVTEPWRLWFEESTNADFIPTVNIYEPLWERDLDKFRLNFQYIDWWSLFSQIFFPISVALVLANGVFIFINILAIWRRNLVASVGPGIYLYALLVPLYWILISIAAWKGFLQLLQPGKAHFWEKTQHGLFEHASHTEGGGPEPEPGAGVPPGAACGDDLL